MRPAKRVGAFQQFSPQKKLLLSEKIIAASEASVTSEQIKRRIPVKVVVVTMFETGNDTGDAPGEFQFWVDREKLRTIYPLPNAYHDIRGNDRGIIGLVTGIGTARSAASIMALGLDPRFDLTHAYWIVAGIAGIDPADGTPGSAVWADWVVDGDLAYEIDAREMPGDWATGYVPLQKSKPYQQPAENRGEAYQLNPTLVEWAYQTTKDTQLGDDARMRAYRALYRGDFAAQEPPRVLKGADLSGSTYWHGRLLNRWANEWVTYWTKGKGNYTTTSMEDSGILQSLSFLAQDKKVDLNRVLVLRAASDFDSPPPDLTAAESLPGAHNSYHAYSPAYESAYLIGSRVVHNIVNHWSSYRDKVPNLSHKVPSHAPLVAKD